MTAIKMENKTFTAEHACPRADVFVCENVNKTRSSVKKLFDGGFVCVNGKAAKPSQEISIGDLAVVNKPQGMTVHLGNGNVDGTLVNALLYRLNSLSGINGVIRPGIVHRIDKDTSGLLVVAKNDNAHISLSAQIAQKTCRRTYIALLEGNLKNDSGTVTTYIGRSPHDRVKMAVVPPDKGKLAVTDYRAIKRYAGYTLCRFDLHTGRTHQIRVHAKYLGHPVVGDPVYGFGSNKFKLKGQLLHAAELSLTHPVSGEVLTFKAPLPDYFEAVLSKLTEL